jgi:PST family polysaccharide transporter
MTLIKTSILSGISTLIKMFAGFILNKIIAIYVGPTGLAFIGQFQNFSQLVMNFASGAINQGVVKYTSEYKNKSEEKIKIWSSAVYISSICTFIVSILLIIFNNDLSIYFFKTDEYDAIFIVFALTLFFFVLNSLFISILNGQGEIVKLTIINISSSIVTLLLTGFLSYYYKMYGALLSLTLGQSVVFIITFIFVIRCHWFKIHFFISKFSISHLKKLFEYALMATTSALTVPVSQVIIRNYIGENLSWDSAGYWEGVTRISSIYLMMVTTTLSIYYLPKLSSLENKHDIRVEIFNAYKIIMPIIILGAASIFFLRNYAITILFTKEFQPMQSFLHSNYSELFSK